MIGEQCKPNGLGGRTAGNAVTESSSGARLHVRLGAQYLQVDRR